MEKIVPFLWFDDQAEEAVEFYTSIFEDSRVVGISRYGEGGRGPVGEVMTATFELAGQRFMSLNGGPEFRFTEAISLYVSCGSQAEVDQLWDALLEGGEESQCGWLKDRYGLSWQIVPEGMDELFADPDPGRAQRAMQAMLGMRKLDVSALRAAADGAPVG